MNLGIKSFCSALIISALTLMASGQSSYAWDAFAETNRLYAVGELGSEKSYLYKIDPLTGELSLIGDTGLNNCTGLDFTPEGKLKAFCELREEGEIVRNGLKLAPGVAAELDTDDGVGMWAVPHGLSSNISDIAINDSGVLFSYENTEPGLLHKHLQENDFFAELVGESDIEAGDYALAFWGDGELKVAANTGAPALFMLDAETGAATKIGELSFPDLPVLASTRQIEFNDIEFASMDSVDFNSRNILAELNTKAGASLYGFDETEADFAVLIRQERIPEDEAVSARIVDGLAIGLIDTETMRVGYIVDIQGEAEVRAIAVRPFQPRPIPTMSEWGLIVTASAFLILALIVLIRRGRSVRA